MPSSLIWIALVVGWVLVLFPMISGRRVPVSRTGAATEETRILHRGGKPRPVRRGPATGHLSDPKWQPSPEEQARRAGPKTNNPKTAPVEAQMDSAGTDSDDQAPAETEVDAAETRRFAAGTALVLDAIVVGEEDAADAQDTADSADEDRVDEAVAEDPVAEDAAPEDPAEAVAEDTDDSILATVPADVPVQRSGRGGFDPEADAAARAVRYRNRQRTMLGLAGATVASIAGAMIFSALFVWVAVVLGLLLVGYLAYLRQQVRMEEQIRVRRMTRLQHSRREATADRRAVHTVPDAARRYGAVVLEADDEDPAFDHLPHHESAVRTHETRAAG